MAIKNSQKSIVEKIIVATFEKLEQSGEYSRHTIEKLRETAKVGELNLREPVVEALESQSEDQYETA
jgi:hypothetical protein